MAGQNNTYMSGNEAPRAFYMPWEATGSFHTDGKWITATIPLTDANLGWNGAPATKAITDDSFSSLWLFICNGGMEFPDATCTPIIRIDNIRVVPIK